MYAASVAKVAKAAEEAIGAPAPLDVWRARAAGRRGMRSQAVATTRLRRFNDDVTITHPAGRAGPT